jgi:Flp pilus assembly protein TadD
MWGDSPRMRQVRFLGQMLAGTMLAASMAGCSLTSSGPAQTGSIGDSAVVSSSDLTQDQAVAAVQKWGADYSRNEKDRVAALNYAAALRAAGETGQAVAVMRKAAIYHAKDREVLAAFGKALAADGQFPLALKTIRRAQREDNPDWQLLSAEGGILDSLGKHEDARARYRQALVLAPGEPQILNNLGLSYLLTDELAEAENVLREAAANPRATLKVKQNLALVLKLRGKADEAAALVGAVEPTEVAPPPLQGTVDESDTWSDLAQT